MRKSIQAIILVCSLLATAVLGIGYASLSDVLNISGNVESAEPYYDVYISGVNPRVSGGAVVSDYFSTVLSLDITTGAPANLQITIVNQSSISYVYERVIDGAEVQIDGIYSGTDLLYSLSGLSPMQELAPGESVTFTLTIENPKSIRASNVYFKFSFLEKTGTEILPGAPEDPDPTPDGPVDPSPSPNPNPDPEPPTEDVYHDDFLGLVEALLSTNEDCLNNNNLIYNAVMESLTSKKRPKEDAPILHCSVNSISGGTMSSVAEHANSKITSNLHFIFEVDPDPVQQKNRLHLYMYYEEDIDNAKEGDEILVYHQIVTRGADGVWIADGTYIGRAQVGSFFGGGSAGKDVDTVNPYTWKAGAPT